MKKAAKIVVLSALSACIPLYCAQAGPSGPSAQMAAHLKKHPGSVWLAHYLPEDRYKIAGGVWKYVATDLDTYYHRPDSPTVLRQPAGRVIGFASAEDAEAAGYEAESGGAGFGPATTLSPLPAGRVLLSDGISSMMLPAGWSKSMGNVANTSNIVATTDVFSGPKGQRLAISTVVFPNSLNLDTAKIANVNFMKSLMGKMGQLTGRLSSIAQQSGKVNNQFSMEKLQSQLGQLQKNLRFSRASLNGIEGVKATTLSPVAGQPRVSYSFGRGRKMWNISDLSGRGSSLAPVLKTLQLR